MKINKKYIFIICSSVVLFFVIFFSIKYNNEKKFIGNVVKAKDEMYRVAALSEYMTGEYYSIWSRRIRSRCGSVVVGGKEMYFSDFNEAIQYRIAMFKEVGTFAKLDSLSGATKIMMRKLNNTPSKYKDIYQCMMDMYIDVSEYESLAQSPEGNLTSFNQKIDGLSTSISRKMKELELRLSNK